MVLHEKSHLLHALGVALGSALGIITNSNQRRGRGLDSTQQKGFNKRRGGRDVC